MLSRDEKEIIATESYTHVARAWSLSDLKEVGRFPGRKDGVGAVAQSQDGVYLATAGSGSGGDRAVQLWDYQHSKLVATLDGHSADIQDVAFLGSSYGVLVQTMDGVLKLWDGPSGDLLATLYRAADSTWITVDGRGRFDTSGRADSDRIAWRTPDDAHRALPPQIFMRNFYQPGLLKQYIECDARRQAKPDSCAKVLPALPDLSSLNRVQPDVRIVDAKGGAGRDDAIVRVRVAAAVDPSEPNGKTRTDAYDLRLFRDGQLVGQWPDAADGSEDLEGWRGRTHLTSGAEAHPVAHDFRVPLPAGKSHESVLFTAYAFNEDRVKSATASLEYRVPNDIAPREPRAYVVTIGVNSYDAVARQLRFAVRDAEAMSEVLSRLDGYRIVRVSLTSDGRDRTHWRATKANIKAALARLAGLPAAGSLAEVQGADQLVRATPDDLVIVTFSGRGYTAEDGAFYLLPSDSGTDLGIEPRGLIKLISSEELGDWLRPIDASQIAMIIDAGHSAGSVAQPGFKPGPLGDRGLGQLAYDKGMLILAASQATEVGLESEDLEQGLLTYALVHDAWARGLDGRCAADLNRDGGVTLAEWLRYGERHMPAVLEAIRTGAKKPGYAGRSSVEQPLLEHRETPALFDFERADKVSFRLVRP
jgi:uncharacterized caspase-like protein